MELTPLEYEVVGNTVLMLREEDRTEFLGHYVDGLSLLLGQPEFAHRDQMRPVVEGVEDGSLAQAVLEEAPDNRVVRVVIGGENRGDVLTPMSVVIGQYGIPGEAAGAIGAIGPVRMEYARTIASVDLMSDMMSEMVEAVHTR